VTQTQVAIHLGGQGRYHHGQGQGALDELSNLVISELKLAGSIRLAGLDVFRQRKSEARIGRR
jgi:hypothetical protein